MSPDVLLARTVSGRSWPDGARDLRSLAPRLAPRNLVSNANVRMSMRRSAAGFGGSVATRDAASGDGSTAPARHAAVSLRVGYDERAISQAAALLDDPPGIRRSQHSSAPEYSRRPPDERTGCSRP